MKNRKTYCTSNAQAWQCGAVPAAVFAGEAAAGVNTGAVPIGAGCSLPDSARKYPGFHSLQARREADRRKRRLVFGLLVLAAMALCAIALYMTIGLRWDKPKLLEYALHLRSGKAAAMVLVAFAIGAASLVFQSIIHNTIVTPCLLGMNSLYTLIHTTVAFFAGAGSFLMVREHFAFLTDLLIMAVVATLIYGWIFKKTGHRILYVLLIGTLLSSLFSSMQSALVRIMDPNEYETLLTSLTASFDNIHTGILGLSAFLLVVIAWALRRQLACLDVMTLGRVQAINLGVDYDHTIRRLLLGVVLYIAIATALVGPVSFMGLITANLARQCFKTGRHSVLIPASALFGTILLVGGQLMTEQIFVYTVPMSVFITVTGGIYFLYLIMHNTRRKNG